MTDTAPRASAGGDLAATHGLRKVGGRPPLGVYTRQVWRRRTFALSWARARAYNANQSGYLGQLWAFLTPLLWALLYYFVFGVILETDRGIPNFAAYLVAGLFVFRFLATAMQNATKAMETQNGLITSLQFPRALVPLAYSVAELLALIPALIVLLAVCLVTGEPLRWNLLLLVPTIFLLFVFTTGVCLTVARLCYEFRDLTNLVPFFNRLLMYVSGVMFSLDRYGDSWMAYLARHQPLAIYIELVRESLLTGTHVPTSHWWWGIGWAVVFLGLGFVYFWRAEAKYGRG